MTTTSEKPSYRKHLPFPGKGGRVSSDELNLIILKGVGDGEERLADVCYIVSSVGDFDYETVRSRIGWLRQDGILETSERDGFKYIRVTDKGRLQRSKLQESHDRREAIMSRISPRCAPKTNPVDDAKAQLARHYEELKARGKVKDK
jgi:hypothetical protein